MVPDAKLAQIRPPAIYGEGSGSSGGGRNEFAGRYMGDGYLITFPLILHSEKKKRDRETLNNELGARANIII